MKTYTSLLTELQVAYAHHAPKSAALDERAKGYLVDGGSLALRLIFQGPLWGARYDTDSASATMLQEQLVAEGRWRFWSSDGLSFAALGGLGVHHLSVEGQATAPYQPERDAAWTALASVGLGKKT